MENQITHAPTCKRHLTTVLFVHDLGIGWVSLIVFLSSGKVCWKNVQLLLPTTS